MSAAPTSGDVERLRGIVRRELGLVFDDAKSESLADLIARRSSSVGAPIPDYLARLDASNGLDPELGVLAEELTVCETYFYRHAEQLRAFAEGALPELLELRAHTRRIRVLSAGCASGDEPLSIAMLLREHERTAGWSFEIRACDVNRVVLAKAARGIYTAWSLRETPLAARERWFRPVGREFEVDPSIRAMVDFEHRNLAGPGADLLSPGRFDVVFCRNMLMYFDADASREVIARLTRALVPGGFLFLGHAETLRGLPHDFHVRQTHGAFYYQRRDPTARSPSEPVRETPPLDFTKAEPDASVGWVDAIHRASQRVTALAARSVREPTESPVAASHEVAVTRAIALLEAERFHEALELLRDLPPGAALDAEVLLLRCALLAHCGALEEAESTCHELLRIDALNAGAHYVLALCREAAGDREDARAHDRVAATLDPAFAMPRLHLGLSARRAGDHDMARLELTRAIELLQRDEPARILLFGGGFSREALVGLCRRELQACGGST